MYKVTWINAKSEDEESDTFKTKKVMKQFIKLLSQHPDATNIDWTKVKGGHND